MIITYTKIKQHGKLLKMANGVRTATNVGSCPPVHKDQDPLGTMQRYNEQELVGTHRQHHWCGVGTQSPTRPHQVMALLMG